MAQKALMDGGSDLGFNTQIETQGQKGQESALSPEIIKKADVVIIAADINVELDRFIGKKVYITDTNTAINDPKELIKVSLKEGCKYSSNSISGNAGSSSKGVMKHILSGVSRMIPFIVFSGIVWAILNAIGSMSFVNDNSNVYKLAEQTAKLGFMFFIAIMGGFIAESIAGRAAMAPGFIGAFIASEPSYWWNFNGLIPNVYALKPDGSQIVGADGNPIQLVVGWTILGAIICGFATGYLTKQFLKIKLPRAVDPILPIIIIPIVVTSIVALPIIFILGAPVGYLINMLGLGIGMGGQIEGLNFLIGFVIGGMIGWDTGGPVNKVATATALITVDPRLMGAAAAAIPIAPLGCGIATLINRKIFTKKEKFLGISVLMLGFFGISEGAIPFLASRPKPTFIANTLTSALAGGLAFMFFVDGHVGMWGGPIVALVLGVFADAGSLDEHIPRIFGGNDLHSGLIYVSILWFFLAITAASIAHSFFYIFLIKHFDKKKSKVNITVRKKIENIVSPAFVK